MEKELKYSKGNFFIIVSTLAWSLSLLVLVSPFAGRSAAAIYSGDLIRASQPAVYYYGADGKRYVFPNEKTYQTWYAGFSGVKTITDSELASITIGGNVTYRPGVKMIKITTDPKVYAVSSGGVLRWITNESAAASLYGADWNKKVEDIPDAFFTNYRIGNPINYQNDFSRNTETGSADTIDKDRGISPFRDLVTDTPAQSEPQTPVQAEPAVVSSSAPVAFYADLLGGPNSGGENNAGAFVTIWGKNFGISRGTSSVTIGGGEVSSYKKWSDGEIIVQLGSAARSGNISVRTSSGASNTLLFTVRAGNIYFVSTSGNDANSGSFSSPWRTVVKAKNSLRPGDIAYLRNGVSQTSEDNFTASLSIEESGTIAAPKALIAYPGETATIGGTGLEFGIRVPNIDIAATDWILSKLVLRGRVQAVDIGGSGSKRWRVVGNDISCPRGDGQTGCFAAALASNISFLGNNVHDVGVQSSPRPSKQYHAVYFTTDTNHVEAAWNHIHDNATCRALQFHSSPLDNGTGYNQYDLNVHDNLIHGDACDGINFATVDPSKGRVRAWNNIIYDVGRGPAPPDGDANYACIYVAGGTNTGADGRGNVEIFNNTLYNCGDRKNSDSGALARGDGSSGLFMLLQNNIVLLKPGESYISESSLASLIKGNNNLWQGAGSAPGGLTGNITGEPNFKNLAGFDFHLLSASPAIDAGTAGLSTTDFDGISRPQGASSDIGAFEFYQ